MTDSISSCLSPSYSVAPTSATSHLLSSPDTDLLHARLVPQPRTADADELLDSEFQPAARQHPSGRLEA